MSRSRNKQINKTKSKPDWKPNHHHPFLVEANIEHVTMWPDSWALNKGRRRATSVGVIQLALLTSATWIWTCLSHSQFLPLKFVNHSLCLSSAEVKKGAWEAMNGFRSNSSRGRSGIGKIMFP